MAYSAKLSGEDMSR